MFALFICFPFGKFCNRFQIKQGYSLNSCNFAYECRRDTIAAQTTWNINDVYESDTTGSFILPDSAVKLLTLQRAWWWLEHKVNNDELRAIVEANPSQTKK